MPVKTVPCPQCGTQKQADAALCVKCDRAKRSKSKAFGMVPPNPDGLCLCGCGRKTRLARATIRLRGIIQGEHVLYIQGHQNRNSPVEYVVDELTGCWNWAWSMFSNGYGRVVRNGKEIGAHRVVYERMRGAIPSGTVIDHLCRNPRCVNPDHMETVSNAVNTRRGLSAKLTDEQIVNIRKLYGTKTQQAIADQFGVSQSHVNAIVHFKTRT